MMPPSDEDEGVHSTESSDFQPLNLQLLPGTPGRGSHESAVRITLRVCVPQTRPAINQVCARANLKGRMLCIRPVLRSWEYRGSFAHCDGRPKALPLESATFCKRLIKTFTLSRFRKTLCAGSYFRFAPKPARDVVRALPARRAFSLEAGTPSPARRPQRGQNSPMMPL